MANNYSEFMIHPNTVPCMTAQIDSTREQYHRAVVHSLKLNNLQRIKSA